MARLLLKLNTHVTDFMSFYILFLLPSGAPGGSWKHGVRA
jgi:hypothetical protein